MKVRLKKEERIQIKCADDMYAIMQRIQLRENRVDRNREHVWTISLDTAGRILNVKLVSMGSVNRVVIEPMEVLSIPLQKRAVRIILVHNHPSGVLNPSESDKDITDRMIQCGLIMHVPVLDHLIISETAYYSFADSGLLAELALSKKYVPPHILVEQEKKEVKSVALEHGIQRGIEQGDGVGRGKEGRRNCAAYEEQRMLRQGNSITHGHGYGSRTANHRKPAITSIS